MAKTSRKKQHHFVHKAYLDAWKVSGKVFTFDLISKKTLDISGRNRVGAIGAFYNFTFDETVVALLNHTFKERAIRADSGGVYNLMLSFTNFMKDFDYERKEENLLEDFYGHFETRFSKAMRSLFRGELQIIRNDPDTFESLIFFYCVQSMRVPKARNALSEKMVEIVFDGERLNEQQKDEYIKMHLLINSLAMAVDILKKGCSIRLCYARFGEKVVTSDAPVMSSMVKIERLEDYRGSIPLSPRFILKIDDIGSGQRMVFCDDMSNAEAESHNLNMILNAERQVYFSSHNHREKYLRPLMAKICA